jgi:putative ABC transport system substrate-binding protein
MRRRDFITLLGGAAAWPVAARAQQPWLPVVGFLSLSPFSSLPPGFRRALAEAGYVPDQNLAIQFRSANFNNSLTPRLAADLVGRGVSVIVASGSPYVALAAKEATSTVPIVFLISDDPVKYGLVASFNRPGGNVTGVDSLVAELAGKRLNLLVELVPQATAIGYLSGPSGSPVFEDFRSAMLAAGQALGRDVIVLEVRSLDFEAAFASLVEQRAGALIVGNFTLFSSPRNRAAIVELAARHKIPAIFPDRQYVIDGGLMSYAASVDDTWQQVGVYTARILKGAKPADLPVLQPTKFDLVLNLKAAKALDLAIPPTLLVSAEEVIE